MAIQDQQDNPTVLMHFVLIWGLVVAQPLFDLFGRQPEFLTAHDLEGGRLLGATFFLSFVPPLVLFVFFPLFRRLSSSLALTWTGLVLLGGISLLILPQVSRSLGLHAVPAVTLAVAMASGVVAVYFRSPPFRQFVTLFSLMSLIFPALFLFNANVSPLWLQTDTKTSRPIESVSNPVPVIFLIFDELPTISLLDHELEINSSRFPVLASLVSDAVWYRNHSTNSNSTLISIPALLSGNVPYSKHRGLPSHQNHPDNLFALLGKNYSVYATEHGTRLCPERVCRKREPQYGLLADDTLIVLAHRYLPPEWATDIPSINNDWREFRDPPPPGQKLDSIRAFQKTIRWGQRVSGFREFVESIEPGQHQLYYLHAMLPHASWKYLPDGRLLTVETSGDVLGIIPNHLPHDVKHQWYPSPTATHYSRQRHVLQLGFVDRLIGELLERLKALDIYDQSLIVITSDHGTAFDAGLSRRTIVTDNMIDIAAVPLLIKYPGGSPSGVQTVNAQAMDIVPTILDVIGADDRPDMDGVSLLSLSARPLEKTVYNEDSRPVVVSMESFVAAMQQAAADFTGQFGSAGFESVFQHGHPDLLGQSVDQFQHIEANKLSTQLDDARYFRNVDPESGLLLLVAKGKVEALDDVPSRDLAVSVNGIIQATSSLLDFPGYDGRYEVLLPPAAFHKGANDVAVWLIGDETDGLVLYPVTQPAAARVTLAALEGNRWATMFEGRNYESEHKAVTGWTGARPAESPNTHIIGGWAADLEAGVPAAHILVFIDGELFSAVRPDLERKRAVERFGKPGILRSGYSIVVPTPGEKPADELDVRVFALSDDGRMTESYYPVDPGQWPFVQHPRP